jgi:hypothetical protein
MGLFIVNVVLGAQWNRVFTSAGDSFSHSLQVYEFNCLNVEEKQASILAETEQKSVLTANVIIAGYVKIC